MLKVENLDIYADKQTLIKNVKFTAKRGEITGILALNGTGKTRLMKILAGVIPTVKGVVKMDDKEINYNGKDISYCLQRIEYLPDITCFDYVLTGRTPYINLFGVPKSEDIEISKQSLKRVNADHLSKRSVKSLSGGELKRVSIAKLLAQNTDVMLLDEPCAYLDFHRQQKIMSLLKSIAEEENKILFLTIHEPQLALKFCDKLLFMTRDGIISTIYPKKENVDKIQNILKKIYGERICAHMLGDQIVTYWGDER